MKKLSLDKILQSQGFGSRKGCRDLIEDGEVSIDGVVITKWKTEFDPQGLVFQIFDETWEYREKVYLVLNKPSGYECSRKPTHHPAVLTLFPQNMEWRDVQPVGRLDHDTTGLLLLSDDGAFIHAQSSPKRHQPKNYIATTAEPVTDKLVADLLAGVQLIDEPAPIAALVANKVAENQIEIVLEQGKYHQVKRMLAAAGNHCSALTRVQIGGLKLADLGLAEGEWRYLSAAELQLLQWD
ncbi:MULTISPECIES: pseudouridine synthase [Deefgea]|uniref:Pseudouridine synthase n=1 Tax=Deefgea chitinilytica TaxID=570276 RepID=A0ABS2CCZ4_9NEIS|nr:MULTISPECIES: pseudouridine synthase [Deefgea]MBM5571540.1 pseudouridine synthase [Deefgea chitinilytica]MBM9888773.1 rRNA pseudouridine synthase [Deefgea sp. CFH1-16]